MPAQIAILGWGSLLWDTRPEFDEQHEPWRHDGPEIKVEFSRVSQSRRGAIAALDLREPTAVWLGAEKNGA